VNAAERLNSATTPSLPGAIDKVASKHRRDTDSTHFRLTTCRSRENARLALSEGNSQGQFQDSFRLDKWEPGQSMQAQSHLFFSVSYSGKNGHS
jgi:hypothetical protein